MATLIVFYSRTGTTRALVKSLAADLGADVEELRCQRSWNGRWGFIRGCYESWRGNLPEIEPLLHVLSHYDTVVIAGPIWVSNASTPLRAFLQQQRALLPRVAFLLAHGGSGAEQSLRELERISGQVPIAALVLKESDVKQNLYSASLSAFAKKLRFPERIGHQAPARAAEF